MLDRAERRLQGIRIGDQVDDLCEIVLDAGVLAFRRHDCADDLLGRLHDLVGYLELPGDDHIYFAGDADASLPPMGLRLRLKASYSLEGFSGQALVIMQALKRFGLIVADNGSPWYITGAPNAGWNEGSLQEIKQVPGSAFEAVDTGAILH